MASAVPIVLMLAGSAAAAFYCLPRAVQAGATDPDNTGDSEGADPRYWRAEIWMWLGICFLAGVLVVFFAMFGEPPSRR